MQKIPVSRIRKSTRNATKIVPETIKYICPICNDKNVGTRLNYAMGIGANSSEFTMQCSSCDGVTKFWIPEFDVDGTPLEIYMYGKEPIDKAAMDGVEFLPEKLREAYEETIDVFRSQKWSATSVMCRKTLEGIVFYLNGADKDNKKNLYSSLKELPKNVDLSEKLISLADGIRKAGNFGAHFDEEAVPDEELAKLLVEYSEYLLEFSFILPKKVQALNARIEGTNSSINE